MGIMAIGWKESQNRIIIMSIIDSSLLKVLNLLVLQFYFI